MKSLPDHFYDNLERGRGRFIPREKKGQRKADPGAERQRDKYRHRRPFPYVTLAAALKKALAIPSLKKRLNVLEIAGRWEALVGETVAQHVQPASLDKGILVLQTDSSVWRQQISLMRSEILENVHSHFPVENIKQIRVK